METTEQKLEKLRCRVMELTERVEQLERANQPSTVYVTSSLNDDEKRELVGDIAHAMRTAYAEAYTAKGVR
jgi:hypothetical protein